MVATLLTIAITIIAGAAVFGYANSQANVTEKQYGTAVGTSVQALEERFTVVQMNFTATKVTIWLYNMGSINLSPVQVLLYNNGRSLYLLYNATKVISYEPTGCATVSPPGSDESPLLWNAKTSSGLAISTQSVQKVTLTLPCASETFASGSAYTINILGLYGNSVTYSQSR